MASSTEVESQEANLPSTTDVPDIVSTNEREEGEGEDGVLAAGLLSVLSPAVKQIDDKVEQVR